MKAYFPMILYIIHKIVKYYFNNVTKNFILLMLLATIDKVRYNQ